MNTDFSLPQRQSAYGIIIMAANTAVKIGRAILLPLAILFIKLQAVHFLYVMLSIVAIILTCLLFAYLWYIRFTFFLDQHKHEFVINKGIFSRDQITIQLDKIQQVNINQSILQKIIGVYGLKIDTAGADGEEVSIKAIDEVSAYNLKEHLLSRKAAFEPVLKNEHTTHEASFLKISYPTLLKVGLTSHYGQSLAILGAFFYFLIHEGRQVLEVFDVDKGEIKNTMLSLATLFSVTIIVIVLLTALLIINLVRTFYKYFELEISKHNQSLLLSSGLFAKKNTLISPNKVQLVKYSQNYFQTKMNLLNVSLRQAQFGRGKKEHEMQGSSLEIPGCSTIEKNELIKMILGPQSLAGRTYIPDWRFLNLPIFFNVVLPVIVFLIIALNIPQIKPWIGLTIPYILISISMIYISYKKHCIMVNENFIIKKSGIWDISNEIVQPNKIQAISTFQYPWHKSVDVGHLCLHTAAGQIRFKYGNYTQIKNLVNYWLYQVEYENKDWM